MKRLVTELIALGDVDQFDRAARAAHRPPSESRRGSPYKSSGPASMTDSGPTRPDYSVNDASSCQRGQASRNLLHVTGSASGSTRVSATAVMKFESAFHRGI